MVGRLGEVLFWAGCILATLIAIAGLVLFAGVGVSGADLYVYYALTATVSALAFLFGRAARYVLAGY